MNGLVIFQSLKDTTVVSLIILKSRSKTSGKGCKETVLLVIPEKNV